MNQNELINQLNLESEALAFTVVALAILLILFVNRKLLLVRFRERRIQDSLKRIGCDQIRNLLCSDGLDGFFSIDRLALVQDAILLISYKPYGGNIYCAEHIAEWTQVVGQKSFKFQNPLFELDNQLTSVKLLTQNAPLKGYLFFNYSAEFPKGHPDMVLHPGNLPESFQNVDPETINPQIQAAWELLKAHQKQALSSGRVGVKT
ncbi:MAG: NERD domain-containing protein [Gammaproteobacteria bacterium]|nr:NERD domain-containing protein [Gammaproteobacteria bacterium]